MRREITVVIMHPNHHVDDVDNIANIVFPMFTKKHNGIMFSSGMKSRLYLYGNWPFIVRIMAALKNNGYERFVIYEYA